ncbi:hypothetical protein [Bacillus sp. CH30_1T]|uniref:hypothetical protein n=1 Tax=Bacillus sp. CH30_1T TaxID=2604836 RepID=UPI001CAA85E4|nr:hypothetical protein [Bacillus sp. CH30_1T]
MNNFQRVDSISNAHAGREFEDSAYKYFQGLGIPVSKAVSVPCGVSDFKKQHVFDLGNTQEGSKVIIECKSHRWTSGGNVPSAKLTVWNEAMYYFMAAPEGYRKVFFVLRDYCGKRGLTLAEYYVDKYKHLIPKDVEIWEYNQPNDTVKVI